jgi:glucose/arabinose dehydrogenase
MSRPGPSLGVALRLVAPLLVAVVLTARGAEVPPGFLDEHVAFVAAPTAVVADGEGRLLVASQSGEIWQLPEDGGAPTLALDLASRTCDQGERGVLGLALDPEWPTRGWLYVFYTARVGVGCPDGDPARPANRVARFARLTDGTLRFDPASEQVLLDAIPSFTGYHNGGDLLFGRDGMLYVSIGDGGCDWVGNSGCSGGNDAAADRRTLVGKVARITRDGEIPADNPFQGEGTVRCHRGSGPAGTVCREIYASGLRNPFRFAQDPDAAGTRVLVNDVGQNAWEEIDELAAGADYGWNRREGPCANGSFSNCGAPPAGLRDPLFAYSHRAEAPFDGCGSITGGAFVPREAAGAWQEHAGAYLFGDYGCGRIFRLDAGDGATSHASPRREPGSTSALRGTAELFAGDLGSGGPVTLRFVDTAEHGAALYYTSYAEGGELRRILAAAGNRPPVASLAVTPATGDPPLTVVLDASASRDPEGEPLSFRFGFGDDSPAVEGTAAEVEHVYRRPGSYVATVEVRDREGSTATAQATVRVGEAAPELSWLSPGDGFRFRVGAAITLRVRATDREDGVLPPSAIRWTVVRRHADHTHPFVPETTGRSLRLVAPPPEDLAAVDNSWLEVRVIARDSAGNETVLERSLLPAIVPLTFATRPAGLAVRVNGGEVGDGGVVRSWAGWGLEVEAFPQRDATGAAWRFRSWSDRGRARHTLVTPARPTRYVASYRRD